MKRSQILTYTGSLLFAVAIYLDGFTNLPKYLSYPFLPIGLLVMLWGLREARQSPQNRKPISEKARHTTFVTMLAAVVVACIGSVYLNSRSNFNPSFRTNVITALVALALCVGVLYWRVYRRPIEADSGRFPKRWLILLVVALICSVLAEVFAIYDRDSEATREVNRELGGAIKAWESKPPGIERGNELVRRLRSIDSSRAPADVRVAISEYAKALDDTLVVYRPGHEAAAAAIYDPIIAEKKNALDQALKKHLH
jgi:hypothetical protein